MIPPCHESRSRYALFRLLAKTGIGCSRQDSRVDKTIYVASDRQNALEAWLVGAAFYSIYALLLLAIAEQRFDLAPVTIVLMTPLVFVVAFFFICLLVTVGWIGLSLVLPSSRKDPAGQPGRQSTLQQMILLAICLLSLGWQSWFRWIAVSWLTIVALNALLALLIPRRGDYEGEGLSSELQS